jgi:hypothetical protein
MEWRGNLVIVVITYVIRISIAIYQHYRCVFVPLSFPRGGVEEEGCFFLYKRGMVCSEGLGLRNGRRDIGLVKGF